MHRVRRAEGRPAVPAAADEAHAKATATERASHHTLIAGAIDCNGSGSVASTVVEVSLGAAQVTESFLTRGRDEVDRAAREQPDTIDLFGDRKHYRESAAVVVDTRTGQSLTIPPNAEQGATRKHRVEVRAHDDWR